MKQVSGVRIQEARLRAGLSRTELAARVLQSNPLLPSLDRSDFSRIEANRCGVDANLLGAIAEAVGVPTDDLYEVIPWERVVVLRAQERPKRPGRRRAGTARLPASEVWR